MSYLDNPSARRGVGPLSGGAMRQLIEQSSWLDRQRAAIERSIAPRAAEAQPQWTAKIVSSAAVAGCTRRWLYTIAPVFLDWTTAGSQPDTAVRYVDPATGYAEAWNIYEWPTTGNTQMATLGDGTDSAHIPAGFAVVPVAGIVRVTTLRGYTGTPMHIFDRANGIDGECT